MITGEQLRAKRKALKLSVPQLGEQLQIPFARIYKWEAGTRPSDPADYKKLENFIYGPRENVENFPNVLNDFQETYKNANMSALIKIIESQQRMLENQQGMLHDQQETIHFLSTGREPVRKKAL